MLFLALPPKKKKKKKTRKTMLFSRTLLWDELFTWSKPTPISQHPSHFFLSYSEMLF